MNKCYNTTKSNFNQIFGFEYNHFNNNFSITNLPTTEIKINYFLSGMTNLQNIENSLNDQLFQLNSECNIFTQKKILYNNFDLNEKLQLNDYENYTDLYKIIYNETFNSFDLNIMNSNSEKLIIYNITLIQLINQLLYTFNFDCSLINSCQSSSSSCNIQSADDYSLLNQNVEITVCRSQSFIHEFVISILLTFLIFVQLNTSRILLTKSLIHFAWRTLSSNGIQIQINANLLKKKLSSNKSKSEKDSTKPNNKNQFIYADEMILKAVKNETSKHEGKGIKYLITAFITWFPTIAIIIFLKYYLNLQTQQN